MSSDQAKDNGRSSAQVLRPFRVGFIVGAVVTVPAIFLALLVPLFEKLLPFLVPGSLLLQPLSPYMADWHGLVNISLMVLANGIVFGVVAVCLIAFARLVRRQ